MQNNLESEQLWEIILPHDIWNNIKACFAIAVMKYC